MRRKFISVVLILALVLTSSAVAFADNTYAKSTTEYTEEEIIKAIEMMEKYMDVNEDGLIEEHIPSKVENKIDPLLFDSLTESIDQTNEAVEACEVEVTDNLTVIETGDNELVVQGGKVNKLSLYWWGWIAFLNQANTKKIAYKCSQNVTVLNILTAVIGFAAPGYFKAGALATGISGAIINRWGGDLSYYNNSKGTKSTAYFHMFIFVEKQK